MLAPGTATGVRACPPPSRPPTPTAAGAGGLENVSSSASVRSSKHPDFKGFQAPSLCERRAFKSSKSQKMVQARLHHHVLRSRERATLLKIPHEPDGAVRRQPRDKAGVDVQPRIPHALSFQVAMKQCSRPTAKIQH